MYSEDVTINERVGNDYDGYSDNISVIKGAIQQGERKTTQANGDVIITNHTLNTYKELGRNISVTFQDIESPVRARNRVYSHLFNKVDHWEYLF